MNKQVQVAGVDISKPDKELSPAEGKAKSITKRDLATYYESVATVMLPHLRGRPVNMQRFPDGIGGMSFYEKKVPSHFPDFVDTVEVHTADGAQRQVVVESVRSLVYLAQQACLTPHTWLSRSDDLERPASWSRPRPDGRGPQGGTTGDAAGRRAARRPRAHQLRQDDRITWLPRARAVAPHQGLRQRPRVRTLRAEVLVARDPDLFTLEARKDKRGNLARRHPAQRLRPDRSAAVRRQGTTRCPGVHPDHLGRALACVPTSTPSARSDGASAVWQTRGRTSAAAPRAWARHRRG